MKNLKSPWVAVAGIVLVLLATVKHSVLVYIEITETPEKWYHYAYLSMMIIAIDTAVIIFSVHGHKSASNIFALMIGIINLYFFWNPMAVPGMSFSGLVPFLPGLLYSSLFTAALMMFTDIFISQMEQEDELSGLYTQMEKYQSESSELKRQLEAARKKLNTDVSDDRKLLEAAIDMLITQGAVGDKNLETLKRNLRNAKTRLNSGLTPEERYPVIIREMIYQQAIRSQG